MTAKFKIQNRQDIIENTERGKSQRIGIKYRTRITELYKPVLKR